MKIILLTLALIMLPATIIAEQIIELIPLQSQLPQNIVPVIKPLLGNNGSISSMNNQLILKVEKSQLDEIRQLIRQLDRPPKRLLIEVSHEGSRQGQQSGYDVKGKISNSGNSRVNVKIKQHQTKNQFDSNQMIQATEGYPAQIRYGKIIPYQEYDIGVYGNRVRRQHYTTFSDATSGFYVIPRLNGNQVSLEIQQQRRRHQASDGSIAVQSTSTFVSGQLGEWISLGSIGEAADGRGQGLVYRRTADLSEDQQIFVRVTVPR